MANRWGKSGNSDRFFFFMCSKITVDGDCSHELRRHFLLRRKAMINLDSVLKTETSFFPKKVCIVKVKVMIFTAVIYRCESWIIKKSEH